MGRDKRIYRFVQDTRFGRIVIAESHDVAAIVDAVTDYVARRMIEREHALVATPMVAPAARKAAPQPVLGFRAGIRRRRARAVRARTFRKPARFLNPTHRPRQVRRGRLMAFRSKNSMAMKGIVRLRESCNVAASPQPYSPFNVAKI